MRSVIASLWQSKVQSRAWDVLVQICGEYLDTTELEALCATIRAETTDYAFFSALWHRVRAAVPELRDSAEPERITRRVMHLTRLLGHDANHLRYAAQKNGQYLDFGAGDARMAVGVGTGFDYTPAQIHAADILPAPPDCPVQYAVLDAAAPTLPYAREQFGFITCFETLHWITDPAAWLTELARVSRPNAWFILREHDVPPKESDQYAHLIEFRLALYRLVIDLPATADFDAAFSAWDTEPRATYRGRYAWTAMLREAGFQLMPHTLEDRRSKNPTNFYYAVYQYQRVRRNSTSALVKKTPLCRTHASFELLADLAE